MDRIPLALLKAGAETIHSDLYMQTALHWAAIVKAPYEVIFELLKRGAELFRENLFKCSPIDLYKQKIRFGPDPSELGGERTNTAFRSLDQPNASLAELCYHLDPIIIREDGNHLEQTCSALSLPSTYSTEDITKWCLSLLNVAHPIDARVTMLFDGLKKERSKRFTIFQSPLESELDTDARDPILNLSLKNTF
jgi:ankyrin repeat protein